jgi:predicted metalloprotease
MTNQTIEQAVEQTSRHFCNGIASQLEPSNEVMQAIRLLNKELPQALQAQRDAEARVAEIKSELQSDSFSGCILRILQDFASIQEPTNKHYLEASTRVSNAALFHANIDGGKIMFNTIEEALTHPLNNL